MSDFNLAAAVAEIDRRFGVKPRAAEELLASVPPCAEELDCSTLTRSRRAHHVAVLKDAREHLAVAVRAERQAVYDLIDDLGTDELLAILPPSAIRDIVSAIVGDKR
jgi:hypothetical protein